MNYSYVYKLLGSSVNKLKNFEEAMGYVCCPVGVSRIKTKFTLYWTVKLFVGTEKHWILVFYFYRIEAQALEALQEACEMYIVQLYEDSNLLAKHAKRITLKVEDVKLVRRLRRSFEVTNHQIIWECLVR